VSKKSNKPDEMKPQPIFDGSEIAIVGMACRFPGARNVEEFWSNLCAGKESLSRVSAEDLRLGGLDPAVLDNPQYVPWAPFLDDIELFDAGFFGYTPLEAKLMDPQQRLFLECAWEAFEHAGYLPETYRGSVGVFTGAKTNTYLLNIFSNKDFFGKLDHFQIALGNDLACMATRVSYKVGLQGPSYAVHTACSTSLVTVHLACQSLLLGECDMALAGGAAINVPQRRGYLYQKGGILSPDGHCRTFDEKAQGSNFGNGVGAIVLKRLAEARADGDRVWAIIRGSAVNNDGANKASYTAPGVEGQTKVLLEAMASAGVDAGTISYIEAHGTATDLGDSIEMLALTNAFRADSPRNNFCAIGSVKTNIGHLETAAGIAGLIKTALALHHKRIPPSLHFERPNPKIDFSNSPFYVNTKLSDWKSGNTPRRAGVSSFGIGSTNAHVILEEAPRAEESSSSRPCQLVLHSARSESALAAMSSQLARHFEAASGSGDRYLADAAYTLNTGRRNFPHRRALVCRNVKDAASSLESLDPERVFTHTCEPSNHPVVFLFPGLGDHYPGMGLDLYKVEPTFRQQVDRCAELLRPHLQCDVREVLFPPTTETAVDSPTRGNKTDLRRMLRRSEVHEKSARQLDQTYLAQPATFVIEYALAQLWMQWGILPQAMIGYSLGEYVAACLADVFSLEDALLLVTKRARMIQELPPGAMLAVPLSQQEVTPLLAKYSVSLGAINGPSMSVLCGPLAGVEALERELAQREIITRRLRTTHAFHSHMMEPLADPLTELAGKVERQAPRIPFVSNTTGTWFGKEEALDPAYWARHMISPVLFDTGIKELLKEEGRIFLEVGAGQGLTAFLKQHPLCTDAVSQLALPSLPSAYDRRPQLEFLLESVGKLWLLGQSIDWKGFYAHESRQRVALPTYPFERQRYWVDPPEAQAESTPRQPELAKKQDVTDWFYQPVWRIDESCKKENRTTSAHWLIFIDPLGLGAELAQRLRNDGRNVVTVSAGESFARRTEGEFVIRPDHSEDYLTLLAGAALDVKLEKIVHLWSISDTEQNGGDSFDRGQELGFYSLIFLAQALGRYSKGESIEIEVVTNHLAPVIEGDRIQPEKATILGPVRVIPQEFSKINCHCIDLSPAQGDDYGNLCDLLLSEFQLTLRETVVAYRNGQRWTSHFEARPLAKAEAMLGALREKGVYLITGGSGGLGLVLAEHLARTTQARLVLTSRSPIPDRVEWPRLLKENSEASVVEKIRALQRIEEAGGEVLTVVADSSDEMQMRRAVDEAIHRFGAIHGVIHMAGVPGGGIIQLKTREMAERILAPKVKGTLVLEKIFAGYKLDFLVLYSSIASVLGEAGQADYCGASAFLDAYAHKKAAGGEWPTVAINWEIWQEVGIGVHTEVPAHIRQLRQQMLANGILPTEGVDAFDRILSSGISQVIVCPQDIQSRIALGKSLTADSILKEMVKSLPAQTQGARRVTGTSFVGAGGNVERRIAEIWQRILGRDQIGVNDNFFDLGGNSLLGLQLVSELSQELGTQIAPVTLFEFPTVRSLARNLSPEAEEQPEQVKQITERRRRSRDGVGANIAIIGTAGRFPGARNVEELWQILCTGKETVSFFSDEELLAAGVDPAAVRNPRYVRAASVLENIDHFDASLFGYAPREAEIMDPQHRIFLECAWEVLERAGYNPQNYPGLIGVFAGANLSTYLLKLYSDSRVKNSVNHLQALIGNDKDSLTTTVSYKLNLRGPSVAVQTFCSTSLVAVHMACQSLRQGECDMALAGGIRVVVPDRQGYVYEPGGLWPADGHTRSFDAKANGSPFGNGVGIVCLKRLEDALADGDHIEAVIKGTAINNDGAGKAGYTAPSVRGQAAVIQAAMEDAGIDPETIGYIEAHGSATELGDPIEISALSKAFRAQTDKKKFCPIGSVKSNFGHLDRAAGVTALIKTTLALQHQQIPPSINFEEPNPNIDFDDSPFFVNTALREWSRNGSPRRAGVNSLGVGGTNVHVILEEAPTAEPSGPSRSCQLLMTSGKSEEVLNEIGSRLASHLAAHPETNLGDVAYTLQVGRKPLAYRRIAVCNDVEEARRCLTSGDPKRGITSYSEEAERRIVFMFPGVGAHYVGMARGLYDSEPAFRQEVDRCSEILVQHLGFDLREDLYPGNQDGPVQVASETAPLDLRQMLKRKNGDHSPRRIDRTDVSQPLLFVIEYALAQLWMDWGIRPQAMIGYSLGEYVAACLAGVMSLEDALRLVASRAGMIQELPQGALLAVALTSEQLNPLLGDELSLMAINGPEQCVVSGPVLAIQAFENKLIADGVSCRRLDAFHAFHSRMMEPIFGPLLELARDIQFNAPQIPYISNLTGSWITPAEAVDPEYWARHMCQPVCFSQGIKELLETPGTILLEMGPPLLGSIVLQSTEGGNQPAVLNSLRHSYETHLDLAQALQTLGKLWLLGVEPDWKKFYAREKRHRVLLPAYPFQRQRYWIETRDDQRSTERISGDSLQGTEWLYVTSWKRTQPVPAKLITSASRGKWWIFADSMGVGDELARLLQDQGSNATRLHEENARDEERILNLFNSDRPPEAIVYLCGVTPPGVDTNAGEGLAAIGSALRKLDLHNDTTLWVISNHLHEVTGDESLQSQKTALLGYSLVLSRELPNLKIRSIDILASPSSLTKAARQILAEINYELPGRMIAYRAGYRWVPTLAVAEPNMQGQRLKDGAVYLMVNALGALGEHFARYLAQKTHARLVLAESLGLPGQELWDEWLAADSGEGLISAKIHKIRQLQKETAVFCPGTGLSDEHRAKSVVEQALQHFGALDGVLYFFDALEPTGETLDTRRREMAALDGALRERQLDCKLLISTAPAAKLTSEDSAVSFFFDSFAAQSAQQDTQPWTSATWFLSTENEAAHDDAIARLFQIPFAGNIVVSPQPLSDGWNKLEAVLEGFKQSKVSGPASNYPRPNLRVAYAVPTTETQETITQLWRDLLGVKEIGIHDNFLELGGDSLMATRLISRMKDVFHQDMPVRLVFEASTIFELARAVDEATGRSAETDEMNEMMKMLEQLSEEEVEQELLKRKQSLAQGA
jgi:acyl transferase domain-containing protein/acyl carrier protein